ncbi:hypothetical protein N8603_03950 [Verrucomicrobiales bacterium]|nr:hypothetical protein [Verrucomicrobiales bacterium]
MNCVGQNALNWNDLLRLKFWSGDVSIKTLKDKVVQNISEINNLVDTVGIGVVTKSPEFIDCVSNLYWANFFVIPYLESFEQGNESNQEQIVQISLNKKIPQLITKYSHIKDNRNGVIKVLKNLQNENLEKFNEFTNLAIALSLVWDVEFPENWPHQNVKFADLPTEGTTPLGLFNFFIDSQNKGKLLTDLKRLTVRELCFLVDTPISINEHLYAQQVKIKSINDFDKLYKLIPYDQNRINDKIYDWPHGKYSLIKIGSKNGGICMDQSYFTSQVSKSKGVPSILFMGQGGSGVHAWIGVFMGIRGWDLKVGEWRSEKYPVGVSLNPQTWDKTTNTEMKFYLQSSGDNPSTARGKSLLAWALLNKKTDRFKSLIQYSSSLMPRNIEPWDIEYNWIKENQFDLKTMGRFWSRWISNFKEDKGLKAKGQMSLLSIFNELRMFEEAKSLSRRIISENKTGRFDLAIAVNLNQIISLQNQSKWSLAEKKFKQALDDFVKNANNGHLFYNLIKPYIDNCMFNSKREEAFRAKEFSGKYIKSLPGTILDNDVNNFFDSIR